MAKIDDLRAAWEEANRQVREAEERLASAWTMFATGQSGPPEKQLLDEISRLRRECDKRLAAILDGYSNPGKPAAPIRSERPSSR